MRMADDIGLIHFIGIGGIGMSAIAEVLHNLGHKVQGSDQNDGANVQRLRDKGIPVYIGHRAENLGASAVVVTSTAIQHDNPERVEAKERHLPLVRRAEMLAELMRFKQSVAVGGTHGKTTTTSMVGTLLDYGGLDPTIINGGILNAYGTNAKMGEGDWLVAEADESDGSFLRLPADVAIITNIDPEHLDHYKTFDNAKDAFKTFIENLPFYGFGVVCIDHPEGQALRGRIEDRRLVTYGNNPQADVRFAKVEAQGASSKFDIIIRDRKSGEETSMYGLVLPMPGIHNVSNATAAIAVAYQLGVGEEFIREGLLAFKGVKRRFTHTGTWKGVEVFDDYGHHPVEISAVLKAARNAVKSAGKGRVIAIKQPHRYTRLNDLFDEFGACFNDANTVILAPVYEAGEEPIDGINSTKLASAMKAAGHRDVRTIDDPKEIAPLVAGIAEDGDYVIFLGAGNITAWAQALPGELAQLS